MDESAFLVTPPTATIKYGETLNMNVRNNTPGNFSCLSFKSNPRRAGKLTGRMKGTFYPNSAECSGGYKLNHFRDSLQKHYETVPVGFTAPRSPGANVCQEIFKIEGASGEQSGLSQDIEITVTGCKDWSGTIVVEELINYKDVTQSSDVVTTETTQIRSYKKVTLVNGVASEEWNGFTHSHFDTRQTGSCPSHSVTDSNLDLSGSSGKPTTVNINVENRNFSIGIEDPLVKASGTSTYDFVEDEHCGPGNPDEHRKEAWDSDHGGGSWGGTANAVYFQPVTGQVDSAHPDHLKDTKVVTDEPAGEQGNGRRVVTMTWDLQR